MFLFKMLFWLIALPFRLVFWMLGLAVWIVTLPLRIVFGILGLIGFTRLFQLGIAAAAGYFFYRLVCEEADTPPLSPPVSEKELNAVPSP